MKIARVFLQAYAGYAAGDIYGVFDLASRPGDTLPGVKDVLVDDSFDSDIMVAVIDGDNVSFAVDSAKLTAKLERQASGQIQALYDLMNAEIFQRMFVVFGTNRTDSASAYYETWKLMVAKPDLFSSKGLTVDRNMENAPYMTGEPLNSDAKVIAWASFRITVAEAYSVYRMERIEQFRAAVAALATPP